MKNGMATKEGMSIPLTIVEAIIFKETSPRIRI
jgi:hypothetical protein